MRPDTDDGFLAAGRRAWARPLTEREEAARRAALALQVLGENLLLHVASAEQLDALAESLEALSSALPTSTARSRYDLLPQGAASVVHALETHAIGGLANPFAIPLETTIDEQGQVRAVTSFGPAYEGTPGVVHGGFVAAVFDQLLGAAAATTGQAMVTGTLTVRYRRPTPVGTELVFRTGLEAAEGRRLVVSGRCQAGEEVTAEAEAIFVTVDEARYTRR